MNIDTIAGRVTTTVISLSSHPATSGRSQPLPLTRLTRLVLGFRYFRMLFDFYRHVADDP